MFDHISGDPLYAGVSIFRAPRLMAAIPQTQTTTVAVAVSPWLLCITAAIITNPDILDAVFRQDCAVVRVRITGLLWSTFCEAKFYFYDRKKISAVALGW